MNRLFDMETPVFVFLGKLFDLFYLNLLCLICCIPIITIGPSITAMYYCTLKISRKKDSSITRMFFDSFKHNLRQGIGMTLLFIGIILFLLLDIRICNTLEGEFVKYVKAYLGVAILVLAVMISFVFPLLAQFENTTKNFLKYSLLLAFTNFRYTIFIVLLNGVPVILLCLVPKVFLMILPAWMTFGLSLIAFINSKMFVRIFDKIISEL